jgi:hypothetical protein
MANQHDQPKNSDRDVPDNKTGQSQNRQEPTKNAADRDVDEQAKKGGGEESKHGRKQKGNVDDS